MEDSLYAFNYTRNRDKLFANLVSIIDGIVADGAISGEEVLYLDTWLLEANEIIDNGVIKALRNRVSHILEDGIVTEREKQELKNDLESIQRDVLDIPGIDFFSAESDLHLLNGLCKGLISDKSLNDKEIHYLDWWLTQNGALKNNYPGKDLYLLVKEILSDGVITKDESNKLYNALKDFTGVDLESGVVDGLSTRLPVDFDAPVYITNKTFCLTGTFTSGKRSIVENLIIKSGGKINKGITKQLDYLVIGTLITRDWRFSSHGRKIEKAVTYRDDGTGIKIINEDMLFNVLP